MNRQLLEDIIKEKSQTPTMMAAACGLSVQGWYNKINGKSKFNLDEATSIKKHLSLTNAQANAIFFTDKRD